MAEVKNYTANLCTRLLGHQHGGASWFPRMVRSVGVALFFGLFTQTWAQTAATAAPVLRMVYKESGKAPYMAKAPDSSGLYADLVGEALQRIGYRLEVVRVPKARAYLLLQRGEAELYPALLLNAQRGEFLAFLRNGLHRDEEYLGLSSAAVTPLRSVRELASIGVSWIYDRGSATEQEAIAASTPHYSVSNLDLARAIELVAAGRPVFYKVVDDDLSDYLDRHNLKSLNHLPVRLHEGLFKPVSAPLYLGFSKASPLYQEEANPAFDPNRRISAQNYPVRPVSNSVPDRLGRALEGMIKDGTVAALMRKYNLP